MKQILALVSLPLLIFFLTPSASAQQLTAENTYEISGKANRGFLGNVKVDEEKGLIELTYVTKSNDKLAKFETYQFDLAFNFKNIIADEIEFEKARTKYKWFKYKGEDYQVTAVSVESNLVGTLVLKKKLITYKWSWFWGGYDRDVKILEKVKPKTEDGNKFFVYTKAENSETGDVIVLVSEKGKIGKGGDPYITYKKFHVLNINANLEITQDTPFDFEFPQSMVKSQIIQSRDSENEDDESDDISAGTDLGVLFAPMGGSGFNKVADPNAKNYTFIRIGADAKLKDKISFESKMSVWGINAFVTEGSNTFIFGPAKDEKYFNQVLSAGADPETLKWDHFQIMKIEGKSVGFVNAVSIDEFEAKVKTPPSQKKAPAYKGKKFAFSSINFASSGDVFIMGQNFSKPKDKPREYRDPLMFQFSSTGELKAQYGVRRDENNKYAEMSPCFQQLVETSDKKSIYWIIGEIKGMREEKELRVSKLKVLMYPAVAKLDIANATVGDFKMFGQEKYYLNNRFPFLPIDQANSIVFFGENKNGKTLWFGKMPVNN